MSLVAIYLLLGQKPRFTTYNLKIQLFNVFQIGFDGGITLEQKRVT
ncbi:hypothetical protein ACVTNF_003836 [Photobacterium damselae]